MDFSILTWNHAVNARSIEISKTDKIYSGWMLPQR